MGNTTKEIIAEEIGKALAPLDRNFASIDTFEVFMFSLGWNISVVPIPIQNLSSAILSLKNNLDIVLAGNSDLSQYEDLFTSIRALFSTIDDLSNADFSAFPNLLTDNFTGIFPVQLIEFLIIEYLINYQPPFGHFAKLFGLIEIDFEDPSGNRPAYVKKTIRWDHIPKLITDPTQVFEETYGWGTNNFNSEHFIINLQEFLIVVGFISFAQRLPLAQALALEDGVITGKNELRFQLNIPIFNRTLGSLQTNAGLILFPLKGDSARLPGISILPYLEGNFSQEIEVSPNLFFRIITHLDLQGGIGLVLRPSEPIKAFIGLADPSNGSFASGELAMRLLNKDKEGNTLLLIGSEGASRFEYQSLSLEGGLKIDSVGSKELFIEFQLVEGKLVLDPGEGDGFLQKVLPENGVEIVVDITIGISSINGLYFKGSAGLEILIPVHKDIFGIINIESVPIGIKATNEGLKVFVALNGGLTLGPFKALVEGIGVNAQFEFPGNGGNLGPINAHIGFKPPKGLGLFLETTAVKGGGYLFFDHDNHKYAGVAELSIKDKIALKAIGLISTRMPDGSKGFSMLLIITAEFTPINIGFGFTLNGVGGLVGIHRTMLLDVLRTGVKTGAIANILFPVDPVKNAPALIASIGSVFPVAQGRFAFGIMGKFGWGTPTLITIDLGLIIEVPNPVRFAILGVLRVALPSEDTKTIRINVNFLGTIEFEKKQIAFDASIFDSQLGEVTLTGDMALRIGWGNNKNFLLSVGGFHPSFQAPPALLYLSRITVNFLSQKKLSLVLTTYMAVTSNTAQFGAKIALDGEVTSKLTFKGHVSLDALFQFKPFHMDVLFEAYLALLWKGKEKMSISVSASLTGPSNWVMNGEAEAKILGIKFKVAVAAEWGRKEVDSLPGIYIAPMLLAALGDIRNWEANLPASKPPLVKLRKYTSLNPVVHPHGLLKISQKQVPLNVVVQKFGSQPANDAGTFVINTVTIGSSSSNSIVYAKEDFAPAQFREMSDTAKLSSPSFTQFDSGAVVGDSILKGVHLVTREIAYEVSILGGTAPNTSHAERPEVLEAAARASAAARTPLASVRVTKSALAPLEMTVLEEKYGVVDSFDLRMHTGTVLYPTMVQALDKYAALVGINPLIKNELRVIPEFEITP